MSCANCPRNGSLGIQCGWGNPATAKLVLVGDAPLRADIRNDTPFSGRAGALLNQVLMETGYKYGEVYITFACFCVGSSSPKLAELRNCRENLINDINSTNANIVVALGAVALKGLLNKNASITDSRGRFYKVEGLKASVLATFHPAAIVKDINHYGQLKRDITKAMQGEVNIVSDMTYVVADTLAQFKQWVDDVPADAVVALDVENDSTGKLICIGLATDKPQVLVISQDFLADKVAVNALESWLKTIRIVAHNGKYDMQVLWANGFNQSINIYSDTMLQSYLQDEAMHKDETAKGRLGLKFLVNDRYGVGNYDDEIKPYISHLEDFPDITKLYKYNAFDAYYTFSLYKDTLEELTDKQREILHNILVPTSHTLSHMEFQGVLVDIPYVNTLQHTYTDILNALIFDMTQLAGEKFNPNSPKQLSTLLYDTLQLPVIGSRKARSTDKGTLLQLVDDHPIVQKLLDYRKGSKFLSTYLHGMLEQADENGRVHTRFNITSTVTGRLSSNRPNLQNITRGPEARNMFMATPGWMLVDCDESQVEIRVWGMLANDPVLTEALCSGLDFHTRTGCIMYNQKKISKKQRTGAKTVAFGVIYQMTAKALAQHPDIRCSEVEAEELIARIAKAYPIAWEWTQEQRRLVHTQGYVVSPFGYIRRFPVLTPENRNSAERQAVNFPVQNGAAIITLKAMNRVQDKILQGAFGNSRLILTVHDSIMLETTEDVIPVARQLKAIMEEPVPELKTTIPLLAEASYGTQWGAMTDLKEY